MFSFLSRKPQLPRQTRPRLESLDSRLLLAAGPSFIPSTHVLRILGSQAGDVVQVNARPGQVVVTFNGRTTAFVAGIAQISVASGPGNDAFVNNTGFRSVVDAGTGTDTVFGGSRNDVLRGGEGNDRLRGRGGDDILEGNLGDDSLSGGLGRDSVDGGGGNDRGARDSRDTVRGVETIELVAILTGIPGASGQSEFKPGTNVRRNFEAEAFGLVPGQTYAVFLDGTSIGSFRTESLGNGELKIINPNLPANDGSVVQIRDAAGRVVLSGTFTNTEAGDDHGGRGGRG